MKLKLPKEVLFILEKLKENNYKGYIVGGCVRDHFLDREPKDWDITTNASPETIIKLFDNVIPTGIKYGTVTVIVNEESFEITTFRSDGKYSDDRHPDYVSFSNNIEEDLKRRDLTMNAIAYSPYDGLIDPYNGINDIRNKIIRAVDNPIIRFKEDPLRILRAIRFSCQLNFNIEPETYNAIIKLHCMIANISSERIKEELNKILLSDYLENIKLLSHSKIDSTCVFGINLTDINKDQNNPYHNLSLLDHTIKATKCLPKNLCLRLAMFYHDFGKLFSESIDIHGVSHYYNHAKISKQLAKDILKNHLKYSNKIINKVILLIEYHDCELPKTEKSIKRLLNKIGENNFRDLILIKSADILAQNPDMLFRNLDIISTGILLGKVLESNNCFQLKDLKIDGHDIINCGFKGKIVGDILNDILNKVIENELKNNKEILISFIENNFEYRKLRNMERLNNIKFERRKQNEECIN